MRFLDSYLTNYNQIRTYYAECGHGEGGFSLYALVKKQKLSG
jgi:hypothetical protein